MSDVVSDVNQYLLVIILANEIDEQERNFKTKLGERKVFRDFLRKILCLLIKNINYRHKLKKILNCSSEINEIIENLDVEKNVTISEAKSKNQSL